jgi:general secretion pathway protein F
MVRAGEASGALDLVLIRLAEYTERAAALRAKVRSALTYPVFMGIASMGILFFLLSYVVPKVTRIFEETNAELPTMTVVLLAISGFLSNYWWAVVGVILTVVISVRLSTRTPAGRLRFDKAVLRIPYFGKVLKKVALARFVRTLSTLLLGGIQLVQSLDIVKHVVSNMLLSNAIEDARNSIREGHSVADPLKKSGLFPPLLVHMIAVGEKSGELEQMLARAADAYDSEVEASVSALSSLMEPVLVLFMGGVVLFIVMAILLPIFELNELVK